ncbi:MAG: cytochrome c oxidase subunit [Solirubrobacteraceae bacterium]|nr:cytochrome c oxidase subunit [Solirubrobacteraceae bacterium]
MRPNSEYNPAALRSASPIRRRRRVLALALVAALAVLLVAATGASADLLSPESGGSPNADRIDTLYWLVFAVAVIVFVGVEGLLFYSLFKFRARKGVVPAQIRGNTRLEVGWTVGAALILVLLSVFTFAKLGGIRNPDDSAASGFKGGYVQIADSVRRVPAHGKFLNVCVTGQQYIWRYTYAPDCNKNNFKAVFSYTEMVVPTDTTVTLDIYGQDVAHSWWVPKLGGKFDAIPGYVNHTWFKVPGNLAGTVFRGQCAELCGRNHANMIAQVRAVTPQDFETFLARRKADIKAADVAAEAARKQVEKTTP